MGRRRWQLWVLVDVAVRGRNQRKPTNRHFYFPPWLEQRLLMQQRAARWLKIQTFRTKPDTEALAPLFQDPSAASSEGEREERAGTASERGRGGAEEGGAHGKEKREGRWGGGLSTIARSHPWRVDHSSPPQPLTPQPAIFLLLCHKLDGFLATSNVSVRIAVQFIQCPWTTTISPLKFTTSTPPHPVSPYISRGFISPLHLHESREHASRLDSEDKVK